MCSTREVTYHTGDKLAHRSIDEVILEANFQPDCQVLNPGFVTETEFEEFVNLASTEPRESGEFVDHNDIQAPLFDVCTEPLVLFALVSVGPANDVCVGVDCWLVVRVLNKLLQFVELPLWVLVGCRDPAVDRDRSHTSRVPSPAI